MVASMTRGSTPGYEPFVPLGRNPSFGVSSGHDMNAHPYQKYEETTAWKIIDEAISELISNQDLKELTARSHIVGFLVQRLVETETI
jgi:hypothetical protein